MKDLDILQKLIEQPGPTGWERPVQSCMARLLADLGLETRLDAVGNLCAFIPGSQTRRTIMFSAHADSVGFMVKYIDESGFVFTEDLQGSPNVDPRTLPGMDVHIHCRRSGTVIAGHFNPVLPYHYLDLDTLDDQPVDRVEVAIDIGAHREQEASKYVSIGDYVTLVPRLDTMAINSRLVGTCLDNRVGLYCLYRLAKTLICTNRSTRCPIVLVSNVGEEGLHNLLGVAAKEIRPDMALTIDGMPATDMIIHDADFEIFKRWGKIRLDDGPCIARGAGVDEQIFQLLESLAIRKKLGYQIELSKLDTDNQFIQAEGIPTGLIMYPMRNAHSRIETVSPADIEATIKLARAFVQHMDRQRK